MGKIIFVWWKTMSEAATAVETTVERAVPVKALLTLFKRRNELVVAYEKAKEVEDDESAHIKFRRIAPDLAAASSALHAMNRELAQFLNLDELSAKKFAEICRRTHWQASEPEKALLIAMSELARLRFSRYASMSLFAEMLLVTRCEDTTVVPRVPGAGSGSLLMGKPIPSINDIPIFGQACAGQYLLCGVLATPLAGLGLWFLAEDARGNVFWVHALHSPSVDARAASGVVYVGLVVAVKNPVLTLCPDSWQRRVRCELESNFVPLPDMSLWMLRGSKWYEKPCANALQWKLRGNVLFENGHFLGALAAYSNGVTQQPDAIDLLSNRANANLKLGLWRAAAADAAAVLAIEPTHRKCAVRRAVALGGCEEYEQCIDAYRQAAKIVDDAPSEVAVCTLGADGAMVTRDQTQGVFNWHDLVPGADALVRVGTFVSPSMRRGAATPQLSLGAWVADRRIGAGTLLLIETPLATAPLLERTSAYCTMLLADAVLLEAQRDELKRDRVRQLADSDAGSNVLELTCATHYFELFKLSATSAVGEKGGLFFAASGFAHSCLPNCAVASIGNLLLVQTIVDIEQGQELLISKCLPHVSLSERTKQLKLRGIVCGCQRCSDEASDASYIALEQEVCTFVSNSRVDSLLWRDLSPLWSRVQLNPLARRSLLSRLV